MKKDLRRLLPLVLVLAMLFTLLPMGASTSSAASGKNFVVYFPNWGMYNAAHMSMNVGMIPWNKVTCINHAFFTIDTGYKLVSTDEYADFQATFAHSEGWDPGMIRGHFGEYKYYKTQYPNVKVVISVGGWTRGENFHAMALTPSSRAIFIQSVIDFLKKYPFIDGVDLDWEYPGVNRAKDPNDQYDRGCPGGPEDKQNFTALLREIRQAYNNNGMSGKLLTIAAPGGYEKVDLTEPNVYSQYLDWLNIMTYDIHGAWDTITNHQSAIYKNPNDPSGTSPVDIKNKYNTDYIMKHYRDTYNIPASKLNVGSPFYSRGWKNVVAGTGTNGLFATASGAPVGNLDDPGSPGGQNSYAQMKVLENTPGYTKYRDSVSQVPWLYNSSLGVMYTYEDETSAAARCDYVINNGFGGIIGWEISCDTSNFSLTNTISGKLGINSTTQVAAPTFSPAGGTYASAQNVTISCATAGATIRYTTDGSEPTAASTQYAGAINVSGTTTIKARAFKSGMNDSATASATYNIQSAQTVAAPVFSPNGGSFSAAQNVTISCATSGATIRYTTDGSEPNSTSAMYTGQINISGNTIIKAKAFKAGMNDSAVATAAFTITGGNEGVDLGNPSGAPATGSISHNNWDGDGAYDITMNIWWGNNATSWTVYENDKIVFSGALQGNSPNAQTAVYSVSGRANGTYTYRIDLKNRFGTTSTNTITVNVTNGGTVQTVAAPAVSPAGGTYATEQNITASCATGGATIRYTTDGTEPTENSAIWSGALTIANTTTIKFKAFKTGMNPSETVTAAYTIQNNQTAATPAFSPAGGTYSSAQNVTISCATAGAAIRYTTDGSTPTSSSAQYTGPIAVTGTKTIKAIAMAAGMNNSAVATATYTIGSSGYPAWAPNTAYSAGIIVSYNGSNYRCLQAHTSLAGWEPSNVPALWEQIGSAPAQAAAPAFSPAGGTYPSAQNVTISCATAGADIRYTTDGSTPTSSSAQYTGPIAVTGTKTIKAIAIASGMDNSAIASAVYTISTAPPTGSRLLVGYWHNFDNGLTPVMTLRNVSTKWDVINVAFADIAGDGTVSFTPFNATDAAFSSDVSYLKGLGKKVVLSLGGQNGALSLPDSAAKTRFTNSLIAVIDKYGFNGVDIDIETGIFLGGGDTDFRSPTTPTIVNLIAAMKDITARYGSGFTLSMAPEVAYVQGGITAYGGPWGAYLPIIYSLKDQLSYIHVQHYNCGGNAALDGRNYNQGTADFEVAMAEMLLKGFPVANNSSNMFPALKQDQVMIGLPAASGAAPSGGYINPAEMKKALDYLIKGTPYGGTYKLQNASGYSGFKGLMSWSVNWDAQNNYEFTNNYRAYFDALK